MIVDPRAPLTLHEQLASAVPQYVSVILGGVLGFVGSWFTNRAAIDRQKEQFSHDLQKEKASELRKKGEELFVLLHYWSSSYSGHCLTLGMAMQGKLTFNQVLEFDIEQGNKFQNKYEAPRIDLFIKSYFPACDRLHEQVLADIKELNSIEIAFKHAYESGDLNGAAFLGPYVQAQVMYEKKLEQLKGKLVEEIRAIQ